MEPTSGISYSSMRRLRGVMASGPMTSITNFSALSMKPIFPAWVTPEMIPLILKTKIVAKSGHARADDEV